MIKGKVTAVCLHCQVTPMGQTNSLCENCTSAMVAYLLAELDAPRPEEIDLDDSFEVSVPLAEATWPKRNCAGVA